MEKQQNSGFFKQPKAVWAVAFACVISFMGIGLVDPILPAIAAQLHASPSQVSLLFTSYLLVTGFAMILSGAISSRIGAKQTLISGLILIIIFAALGGFSHSIAQLVGFRGGWGLGNALFISTALAVIVSVATGGSAKAIILYEAALGLGISVGPLAGGELGTISWRAPFFGVSILMAVALLAILILLPAIPKPQKKVSIGAPIRALRYRGLLTLSLAAFLYNFGFFTLLAYSPFVLDLNERGLGYVFFGWGLLLAITSVFTAPAVERALGTVRSLILLFVLFAADLLALAIWTDYMALVISFIVIGGGILGMVNTILTTAVMGAAPVERSVASSAYSSIRFIGGAIAPWLAGVLADHYNAHAPYVAGCIAVLIGMAVLIGGRRHLANIKAGH
ncbi:MFS transporter [Bacillus glycinifermentans]|uniref:MFS transporter n=1 Tax=Bacillus glycinifermentans TaxID=1664069 RepID=A0A0J6ENW1_9BACI|nr:MFS transporter [Bacillus glycinifermentans]ATH94685.1 MFS transporter [Bacillus glycinifermentans]KMM57256.1 MFS transporter [Bacillus glycinifermentans]KRT93575.1 MFS transporter [Bacillus glycinifermentans]MEC0486021.1 MFS transporter [Bacillus glycinifermentans]MEC0496660.1 MFS transporter [Bacillus glycinifermentans]